MTISNFGQLIFTDTMEYFLMTDSFYAGKYKNVKFHEGYVSICVKPASLKEYSFWFSLTSIKYTENKRTSWEFSLVTLDAEIVITKIWQFDYDYQSKKSRILLAIRLFFWKRWNMTIFNMSIILKKLSYFTKKIWLKKTYDPLSHILAPVGFRYGGL